MYQTKQMSYNTEEKPIYSCTNELSLRKKEYHENWLYQITLCILWDLSDNAVDHVCVASRKGLSRTLDLPVCTHSRWVAPVCGLLPLRDDFVCRCASFILTCLSGDNTVVKAIVKNGVDFMRMFSPLCRNAQQCCDSYIYTTSFVKQWQKIKRKEKVT